MRKYYKSCSFIMTLRMMGESVVIHQVQLPEEDLVNSILLVLIQGRTALEFFHNLIFRFIVEAGSLAVTVVVHRPVECNT